MEKSKEAVLFLMVVFIIMNLFYIYLNLFSFNVGFGITGKSLNTGGVILSILGNEQIEIHHPLDKDVYEFNKSLESYYSPLYELDLNASATFDVIDWQYSLRQITPRGGDSSLSGSFSSGSPRNLFAQLDFFRWNNTLTVSSDGYSDSINFYINVPNSVPIIFLNETEFYACENNVFRDSFGNAQLDFIVVDRDEDVLSAPLTYISPRPPFSIGRPLGDYDINYSASYFKITSRIFRKNDLGGSGFGSVPYSVQFSVLDGNQCPEGPCMDTKRINVTVLEVNNAPAVNSVGVQTIWTRGENSTFNKQFWVQDLEDGNSSMGKLNFSIQFLNSENLFEINETGWMFFESNESYLDNGDPKIYLIEVCAEDNGLENPHENITYFCGQNGSKIKNCSEFSLTITNENRPPLIIEYYPSDFIVNISAINSLYFNVSTYDPDGTIPDIFWYVDDVLKKYVQNKLIDEFNYVFGCGVSGEKKIKVEITDGLLNDSIEWRVNVDYVACPVPVSSGGGGGGGTSCVSDWICEDWQVCQNLEKSMREGFLKGENYRIIKDECVILGYDDVYCGLQIRECEDIKECGTFFNIPNRMQVCYFTENPSCFDRIKNCHSGGCEVGIDCGGPCKPCPTCSDGIQNQGEEGIDCGGPCPWPCPVEVPYRIVFEWWYLLLGLLLLLIIILLVKWIRVLRYKQMLEEKE
jgi:hypothetical protein